MGDRKSEAEIPPLIEDPIELATREAENALEQFDWAMQEVERWISEGDGQIRVSLLLSLHRKAMSGIDRYAGNFRPANVVIKGSRHKPIAGEDVPRYVEEMLDYVRENWSKRTAIHLSAFVMWRLNWIHPFADGNGRTSRILSYMVLCGRLKQILPGTRTIPEQISENKDPYYAALEAADIAIKKGAIDVTSMENLLEEYLANQLVGVHDEATGNNAVAKPTDDKTSGVVHWIESKPVIIGSLVAIGLGILALIFAR